MNPIPNDLIVQLLHQTGHRRSVAGLLMESFLLDPVYGTPAGSHEERRDVLGDGIAFCALRGQRMHAWIGALLVCRHRTCERHVRVVARAAGVITIMLGTEDDRTTIAPYDDLYAHPPGALAHATRRDPLNPHSVDFDRACGYSRGGFIPDANGQGEPELFMAKRIA